MDKWTSEQNNEYGWVFRKNGKCSFIGPTYADETLISYEDCEWELNGDKITIVEKIKITNGSISYENTDTTIATIKGDTMTIDNGGVYKKKW